MITLTQKQIISLQLKDQKQKKTGEVTLMYGTFRMYLVFECQTLMDVLNLNSIINNHYIQKTILSGKVIASTIFDFCTSGYIEK